MLYTAPYLNVPNTKSPLNPQLDTEPYVGGAMGSLSYPPSSRSTAERKNSAIKFKEPTIRSAASPVTDRPYVMAGTTTAAAAAARPARPPLHQLLCPLTRHGPHRRKPKPQAQPPPSAAPAAYPGDTMCVGVSADERVVSVEQFDCPAHEHQERRRDARDAGGWVEVAAGDGEAGEEWFDVIALGEEEEGEGSRGGGAGKMLLKDSEVERVMREAERDVEVFVEVVRAQGRRVGRWAGVLGLWGWGWGWGDGKKEGGGEEVVAVKGRWGP